MHQNERGFTLPEILVVATVFVLLSVALVSLLRPKTYIAEINNAKRHTDIAQLAQALKHYKTEHGQFPANIPAKETKIGAQDSEYPLCAQLVPAFLKDVPLDPAAGSKYHLGDQTETEDACNADQVIYSSEYSIQRDNKGNITLKAPFAQKNEKIELTIQ